MNKLPILILGCVLLGVLGWWLILRTPASTDSPAAPTLSDTTSSSTVTIIAFGDSLTAGYGVLESESYPAQLEDKLQREGFDVVVINSGVSGETTRGNLERANFIRSQNPDIVLLGIGGNDALRALPIAETRRNLQTTIDTLTTGPNAPRLILLRMQAPLNAGEAYKQEFDSIYEELAALNKLTLVPFLTEELFFDTNNKLPDGIHYNKTGYTKVVDQHVLPAVVAVLKAVE